MAIRGYHQYRGKGRSSQKLLVVLLLLILLGACTFLFLQKYLVYDSDGGVHLELPFGRNEQGDEPGKIPDDEVIIQRGTSPAAQSSAANSAAPISQPTTAEGCVLDEHILFSLQSAGDMVQW
ncbi:MAG: hypothetical protein IJB04_04925 [Oscillospiraceae bacterium]|nr:hypothetical protein [Oscillospiraceae bacterium]